ncbi:nucleotide sugar dehydrogenase [Clostridiaceae bacterium]|nr:nucleotide sugar dehydrogenase [Clostridiaceae bacterium]RKI16910.1 nucleotide sugar dehydrogenase [bacterium 1XD21-70]
MVNVIGLGYIGLPTALMMANSGVKVYGTDKNKELINNLQEGNLSFSEEGLQELFDGAVNNGIEFGEEYKRAEIYIVAVPTPYIKCSKKVDTTYIMEAVKSILPKCEKGGVIVLESTVSPGTISKSIRYLVESEGYKCGEDIHLVHAPERIIPGNMITELRNNNRTIGSDNIEIGRKVRDLYKIFCKGEIFLTDIKTAEMTKVVENTYRDINIAFANELAKICRADNMDVYEIIRIANQHPRVNILSPGPGVGGHCISVDPWFLVGDYPGLANIVLAARKINDSMPEFVLERISEIMEAEGIRDVSQVGLYGITYKENVDDIRESPTLQLVECMKKHLASGIKAYDPYVFRNVVENQYYDLDSFLNDIDLVVIMVGHNEIIENMVKIKDKIVMDTRNVCLLDGKYRL